MNYTVIRYNYGNNFHCKRAASMSAVWWQKSYLEKPFFDLFENVSPLIT